MSKVWFITGGGRAMGTDVAKAAFDAGYKLVATGRNTDRVVQAFRTELLTEESTNYPEPTIDDYSEKTRPAGADAVQSIGRKVKNLLAQADACRELSSSLTFDDLGSANSGAKPPSGSLRPSFLAEAMILFLQEVKLTVLCRKTRYKKFGPPSAPF